MSKICVPSAAAHWFPVLHLNLFHLICLSFPPLSVGLCFQVSLSPPFPRPSLLPLCLPRTAPGSGSGNAAGSSSLAIASSITRVSAPAVMGWAGAPLPVSLSSSLWASRSLCDPLSQPLFCRQSVLGSVLLPSYIIRPDGPGAPRGRRFTFTVSPFIPSGN